MSKKKGNPASHNEKLYGRHSVNISTISTWNYLQKLHPNISLYRLPSSKPKILIKKYYQKPYFIYYVFTYSSIVSLWQSFLHQFELVRDISVPVLAFLYRNLTLLILTSCWLVIIFSFFYNFCKLKLCHQSNFCKSKLFFNVRNGFYLLMSLLSSSW